MINPDFEDSLKFSNFLFSVVSFPLKYIFLVIFEKGAKLKVSSAANYRWRFMG